MDILETLEWAKKVIEEESYEGQMIVLSILERKISEFKAEIMNELEMFKHFGIED